MAIGRTPSRRKSWGVLRWLCLSLSDSSPAAAMPPKRLRYNVTTPAVDRNLILDPFVFILARPPLSSMFERTFSHIASPSGRQHLPAKKVLQAIRSAKAEPAVDVVSCRGSA